MSFFSRAIAVSRSQFLAALTLAALTLAALPFVAPVMAQDATTEAPATPPAPAVVGDAPVDDGLSMGAEVASPSVPLTQETAEVNDTYLLKSIDAWELRCVKTADGSDPCQLYQLLKDIEGNAVAEFSLFALPEGGQAAAGATVIAPLETLLTANMRLAIDGAEPKIYPFTFCASLGCVARVGFTAAEVAQFQKGANAVMTIVPAGAPDQKVDLNISLKGFTAGYDAVKATLPKP